MITVEYINKVFYKCTQMRCGEILQMNPSHPNYADFIEAVKSIIDVELDLQNGFQLEFNSNYSKMKKLEWKH